MCYKVAVEKVFVWCPVFGWETDLKLLEASWGNAEMHKNLFILAEGNAQVLQCTSITPFQ